MITEAEKYLGYPYVWGGSSSAPPLTVRGFVSYVLINTRLAIRGGWAPRASTTSARRYPTPKSSPAI